MNWRSIRALAAKDLEEVRRNRIAIAGAAVLFVVFAVVFPLLFSGLLTGPAVAEDASTEEFTDLVPPPLLPLVEDLTPAQLPIVLFLGYLFAPLFLVIPLMVASVIAAEAFVGEKERRTLEPLLYTPMTDLELFTAKVLAAIVPGVLYAWASFAVYTMVVNAATWQVMGRIWFPTVIWWPLMLLLTPAIALLGVAVTVLISAKVNTFMEAYQASSALVIVLVLLLFGQMAGILFLSPAVQAVIGAGILLLDLLLIRIGTRIFSRSELIARV